MRVNPLVNGDCCRLGSQVMFFIFCFKNFLFDFHNLNLASQKNIYPLTSLEEVLYIVNGSKMMSFLDGYLGYN